MAQTGQRNTYNDTVGVKTDIEDVLPLLVDPYDIPLYSRFPTKSPKVKTFRHEWQEESLLASQDDLGADIAAASTGTITATDGTKFKAGQLVALSNPIASPEKVRVVSVAANVLTVNRGYAGTTAAALTAAVCNAAGGLKIIGQVVADGADASGFITTDRTPKFNLHQTWQEYIELSTQDEWQEVFGIGDKFSHEVDKMLKWLGIRRAYAFIKGMRFEDPTQKARLMGGLDFYITTNVTDALGADIDEDVANAQLRKIYRAGNRATLIAVNDIQKSKVSQLISASMRQYPRPNTETVGVVVDGYRSDYGVQEILMDRQIDFDRAYFLSERGNDGSPNISKVRGMPLTLDNLSKTGAARKSQILGWETTEVRAEKQHAISFNLSTT